MNSQLFEQAQRVIAGGVNSPVRAFHAVGGSPIFIREAEGAYIIAEDGTRYIDYVGSWGAMILGHADRQVVEAVARVAARGLSFGAPTVLETEMAEWICTQLRWIDKVRMVNSGSEAVMAAIRLARGYTGRDKIVKFEGCYHGHADSMLVKAGSGALTFGIPSSSGVPQSIAQHTLVASFNDSASVEEIFDQVGEEIAAIIVEPVAGNMSCVPPLPGFLETLRKLCDDAGSLLIMDEVMTAFRVGLHGAQGVYGVTGDITTLGKIIGGGMPIGAFGGRAEIMASLAPDGGVYQAGTLSGNPIAMAAGLSTLQAVTEEGFYPNLIAKTERLVGGLVRVAKQSGVALHAHQVGAMFGLFFTEQEKVNSFADVIECDTDQFKRFFHAMLEQGIYFAPSAFEAGFVSAAHSDSEIDQTVEAARVVFSKW